MTTLNLGRVCSNPKCNRAGIQVFGTVENCSECGDQLVSQARLEQALLDDFLNETSGTNSQMPLRIREIKNEDTFTCPQDLTTCPIAKSVHVYIPIRMFNSWVYLADQFDTEWIAYLKGREVEGEELTYEITDMYFPKQQASGASVDAEDGEILEGTIGAVHSHVDMNAFFSAQDHKHMNHLIELVVNRRNQIAANGRVKLECGRYHRGPATVEFINCDSELVLEEQLRSQLTISQTQFFVKKPGKI